MKEEPSCSGPALHIFFYLNHGASLPSPLRFRRPGRRHPLLIEVHHVQKTHPSAS